MHVDGARAARLRAYSLMEDTQGDAPDRAAAELVALEAEAEANAWGDVAFLAAAGRLIHALVRGDAAAVERMTGPLMARAGALPTAAPLALALALRAVAAAGREDTTAVLADAGRAVVLVEDETLRPLDRCTVLVVCAAAYNTMNLWELVDLLYDQAGALAPACEQPVQEPAVTVNRVLIRLEWATALFELGEERAALDQLRRAQVATELALATEPMQPLWRRGVRSSADAVAFTLDAFGAATPGAVPITTVESRLADLDEHSAALSAAEDVEVLPLLDALVALSLVRLGRPADGLARLRPRTVSSSSGSRSFPAWVRAQALAAGDPGAESELAAAHQEYGVLVARQRWASRRAVLAAAVSTIAGERLSVEHAALARDVLLDPLTGLSNRRSFDNWLATVPTSDRATAKLLIDLHDFKVVNDLHGHAVGDEALRRVGRVVANHVRPGDLALRLGGDEFAVILVDDDPDQDSDSDAVVASLHHTALKRAEVLREAVALTDWDRIAAGLTVRLSVGVAATLLGPGSPEAADRLYREADRHLYAAKGTSELTTPL